LTWDQGSLRARVACSSTVSRRWRRVGGLDGQPHHHDGVEVLELAGDQGPGPIARAGELQAGAAGDDPGPAQGPLGPHPAGPQPAAQVVADHRLRQCGQLSPAAGRILPAMDRPWNVRREPAQQQREGVGADRVLLGHPGQDLDVPVGGRRAGPPSWPLAARHPTTVRGQGDQGCSAGGPPRRWWGADQARTRQRPGGGVGPPPRPGSDTMTCWNGPVAGVVTPTVADGGSSRG
jgi:hypothetical protein